MKEGGKGEEGKRDRKRENVFVNDAAFIRVGLRCVTWCF